jgi:hypothetical protein
MGKEEYGFSTIDCSYTSVFPHSSDNGVASSQAQLQALIKRLYLSIMLHCSAAE